MVFLFGRRCCTPMAGREVCWDGLLVCCCLDGIEAVAK